MRIREGTPAESVDPARSYLNKTLHGEANAMGALGDHAATATQRQEDPLGCQPGDQHGLHPA